MTPDSFVVQRLHVRRLYGLDHDGLVAEELSPGVNVIYGPNGQGKTTLGRALHGLVWPESVRDLGPIVSGDFTVDGAAWRLNLDGTSARHERDGTPAAPPALPGLDERDRYRLSLHDLIQSDGAGFAEVVARDAAGGMDIALAARSLQFSATTPRSSKATSAAEKAWADVEAQREAQGQLRGEQDALTSYRRRRDVAAQARERAEALALALDHAVARGAAADARAALDELPASLAHVREDDAETLRKLREAEGAARTGARDARLASDDAASRLARNAVESAGLEAPIVHLRSLHNRVQEAEAVASRKEEELAGLRRLEAAAAESVGTVVDLGQLATTDANAIGDLDEYATDAARLNALRQEGGAIRSIQATVADGAPDSDRAEAASLAARALRDWLRTERSAPPSLPRTLSLVGAICFAVGGLALAALVDLAALILLAPAALLAAVYVLSRPVADSRASDAQARYRRAVDQDLDWSSDAVEHRLEELEAVQAAGALSRAARNYASAWADRTGDVAALESQLTNRGKAIRAALGVTPNVHGVQLAYAVRAIQEYQNAFTRREASEASLRAALADRQSALAQTGELVSPFGLDAPTSAAALAQAVATLEQAAQAASLARSELSQATRDLDRAETEGRDTADAVAALFTRAGLDPAAGDEQVAQAVRTLASFSGRHKAASDADAQQVSALRRLREHSAYSDPLDALDPAQAGREREEALEVASTYDALTQQIAAVEARIEDAQGAHGMEEAAARHRDALADLRGARDQAADARLGQLLADCAARASQETQVPPVVRRASELLGAVTAHRYALTFDPFDKKFVARDTVLGRGFTLGEVSSGTRVQVLLCVRVAFIEQHERGARLPLVLDELMANSDEERAAAIVQAVLGLCRDGRQVFYLTSQSDEVAKWRRIAAQQDGVACAFIALGPGVSEPDPDALPHPSLAETPPEPDGRDHETYGAAIGVPRWSARDAVGSLHLWFAVDDTLVLHRLLTAGVTRLGPALQAAEAGVSLGLENGDARRLILYADALSTWQEGWRVGRGQPVLRETLQDSGAITDRFLDRVTELAATHDGDGASIVADIRDGAIKGFRSKSVDDLEASLVETGHIDPAPSLDSDALYTLVVQRVGPECASGSPSVADIRAFLGRVMAGPGSAGVS